MRHYKIFRKSYILLVVMLLCCGLLCACRKKEEISEKCFENRNEQVMINEKSAEEEEYWEKGYDLPVDGNEKEEAESDCIRRMELISDNYRNSDKGDTLNVVLSDEIIRQMVKKIEKTGFPVISSEKYANMSNYKKLESFLKESIGGSSGSAIIYKICSDGGIEREKYSYDGMDMYVLTTRAIWNNDNSPVISYTSYTRLKEWKYSDKGWFCYELCVPEYPEVTEMVDGSCLIRVKPMSKEKRRISEKCVLGLDYAGNNLLCSDWDSEHMKKLDYNGVYEYLYAMKYQKKFHSENFPKGIPKKEFESLIMEYLPVTSEQIQKYAVFDKKHQTYPWMRLGCFNYTPTFFGTSIPEVTGIRENEDGTVTLTVDAVCEMVLCDDAVITHELTVHFFNNGSFQYLGNKILDGGIQRIPDYQYRIR